MGKPLLHYHTSSKKAFREKVDFITSAGFLANRNERVATGVRGAGPQGIVTHLGIMEPDETGEIY